MIILTLRFIQDSQGYVGHLLTMHIRDVAVVVTTLGSKSFFIAKIEIENYVPFDWL